MKKIILALITTFICSIESLAQTTVSPSVPTWYANVPYGSNYEQVGDLYHPGTNLPVKGLLVWIHGGGWFQGDKNDPELQYLAPAFYKGLAVLSVNYRMGIAGRFPNSINDIVNLLNAIETGGTNCPECQSKYPGIWPIIKEYSKKGLAVAGGSAGGYLAVMGAGSYLAGIGDINGTTNLNCINNNVGPLDFRTISDYPMNYQRDPKNNYGEFGVNIVSGYINGDLSKNNLAITSPAYYADIGRLNKTAYKVKWILNYNYGDTLIPQAIQQGFTQKLRSIGANVVTNIANNPPTLKNDHNLTENTKKVWLSQVTNLCFGV